MPKPSPGNAAVPESEHRERERAASGAKVESVAKRARRVFSAAEKLRIVRRADACLASGKRGAVEAMLREEGIYSSHLSAWRQQLGARGTTSADASCRYAAHLISMSLRCWRNAKAIIVSTA